MKIKISNHAYQYLSGGKCTSTVCVNDFVSTTRKDLNGILHQYESRQSLLKAFMAASKSRRVTVVSDDNEDGMVVRLDDVGPAIQGGLLCEVFLSPLEAA